MKVRLGKVGDETALRVNTRTAKVNKIMLKNVVNTIRDNPQNVASLQLRSVILFEHIVLVMAVQFLLR